VQVGRQGFERLRTMMQCQGFRANKDPFLADVWFSTYNSPQGRRLTAMIIDASNETRDREQANLEQVLVSSRIALGALSHEIRNICAAISNVQQNLLVNKPGDRQIKEYDALRQLVAALERMASAELSLVKRQAAHVDLDHFLSDLYIVVQASLREADIDLAWEVTPGLPAVWADSSSLIQVFLNLVRNAQAALIGTEQPQVRVMVARSGDMLHIAVADNGPGVTDPDKLFRPFGQQGGATGLGLYLSKAMMRSFHGDLRYEPGPIGATFIVDLNIAEVDE
jgi:two-component system sensor kinase FixL